MSPGPGLAASPVPTGAEQARPSQATAAPADPASAESTTPDFEKLVARLEDQLPRREELKALPPEAVHHTPELVMKAAAQLAELAQAVADRPELAARAQRFYGDCARREDVVRSIRAHCLARFRKGASGPGGASEVQDLEAGIPAEVRKLADMAAF